MSFKREKVWYEPAGVPGVGFIAVTVGSKGFLGYKKIIYRDADKKCRATVVPHWQLIPRE